MTQALEITKPLDIRYAKTCDCPANHISCVTAKEWVKGMVTIQPFYYKEKPELLNP